MQQDRDTQPWYRQFWPWFLIALPASAVVASLWTISVAVRSPNALVVDDYGKIGIATERQRQRDDLAAALELRASMQIHKAEGTDVVFMLRLDGDFADAPERLELRLTHPTLQGLDRSIALRRIGNGYEGSTSPLGMGRYYIQLEPPDRSWRLTGEISGATRELMLFADAG
jgi:hypothetical protein